ncbi:class F sortase [Actinocrinis puniceicyclus]|uniref:Class F sortase n=1 Tax=Actinocrinis puniceicyclus TaxID=977794 RepID=A0A8J7WJK2_9ACTN|nr:class F sortase [Actinocrinis puniceicyclus]MBS2963481.1 class F sortase [Actinocrinis puniceicyclus]
MFQRSSAPRRRPLRPTPGSAAVAGAALIAAALAAHAASDHPTQPPSLNPGVATSLAAQSPPTSAGRMSAATGRLSRPDRLAIASLGIGAPVVPIGVTANGALAIPSDIHTVGWYRYGPAPGALAGSVVIAGHVDSAGQGPGALFPLRAITVGAAVTVTTADGRAWHYRVIGRQEYPKAALPLSALFSPAGTSRLTLLTCGGPFNHHTGSYLDNLVVTAVPVP